MIGLLRWLAGAALALALTVFAVYNRQQVDLTLHPLYDPISIPLYLPVLVLSGLAFILGAGLIWTAEIGHRATIRRQQKKIEALEKEIETLKSAPSLTSAKPGGFMALLGYKRPASS